MRGIAVFLALMITVFGAVELTAQKQSSSQTAEKTGNNAFDLQYGIYQKSTSVGDFVVATNAVYNMMAIDPSRTDLNDTLAYLYFVQGAYPQCILLGEEILKEKDDNLGILEIVAISKKSVGAIKEALESYEELVAQTGNVYHMYEISTLQYTLKRYGECVATINQILENQESHVRNGQHL